MKNLFEINIYTYVLLILALLSGYFREIFIIYLILFIHEIGHFIIMKLCNISVNKIILYPYGGMIDSNILINTNSYKVLIVSMGGILIQFLLLIVMYYLYKLNMIDIYYYSILYKYNIYIILFNLLPIYPLDGFKIINSLLELFFSFKKSLYISLIISIIILFLFCNYLLLFRINNYIIIIFLLTSLFKYIKNIKYIFNKFYLERVIYDINYYGLVSVNSKDNIFKNKYNYINGVGEDMVLKFYIN